MLGRLYRGIRAGFSRRHPISEGVSPEPHIAVGNSYAGFDPECPGHDRVIACRPRGTRNASHADPALKRWAIFFRARGAKFLRGWFTSYDKSHNRLESF